MSLRRPSRMACSSAGSPLRYTLTPAAELEPSYVTVTCAQVLTGIAFCVTTLSELPGHMWCSPTATFPLSRSNSYPRLPASAGAWVWCRTTDRGACVGVLIQRLKLNGSVREKCPTFGKVNPFSPDSSTACPIFPGTSFGPSWALPGVFGSAALAILLSLSSSKEYDATRPGIGRSLGHVDVHFSNPALAVSRDFRNSASLAATAFRSSAIFASCSSFDRSSVGTGVALVKYDVCPDSSMFWKKAKSWQKPFCRIASNLWSWHRLHSNVRPRKAVPIVVTRSTTYATRNSSSTTPPSSFCMCSRLNAVARRCSLLAAGSRSPASCQVRNSLKGWLRLKARMTQ